MVAPRVLSATPVNGNTVDVAFDQTILQDATFFNVASYTLTGRTISAVSAPSLSVARLTFTPEQLTGDNYTVAVDAALQNPGGEAMDGGFLSAMFVGVGTPPFVSSASALSDTVVRITFSEAMTNDFALQDPGSYVLTPGTGGATVSIATVTPQAIANPTYVDLTLVSEHTDGITYTVAARDDLTDAVGNALDDEVTVVYTGSGTAPTVASAEVLDGETIHDKVVRVHFDEPMRRGAAIASISNYAIVPVTGGAPDVFFEEIVVVDEGDIEYVDIPITEALNGATYQISVVNVRDVAGNPIAANTANFVGVGTGPSITSVEAVGVNRIDVTFDERLADNADVRDPARYVFDNGLTTVAVLEVDVNVVRLVTSDQVSGALYNLTVTP